MGGDIAVKGRRDKKRQADGQHPPATAEVQALLDLATQEALALPPSSRRARTFADLAKQAMQLKAIEQLDQRIAQLEEVLSQRRSDQAASDSYSGGSATQRYGHSSRFAVSGVPHLARRVEGLYPKLSSKERATLALRSMKADEPEDPSVRSTMPPEQVEEFNRLIGLIRGVNWGLGPLAFLLSQKVETVAVRLVLSQMIHLVIRVRNECLEFLDCHTKEPITQNEFSKRLEEAREELAPIGDIADWAAQEMDELQMDQVVEGPTCGGDGSPDEVPSDEAWEQAVAEKQAMLEDLIAQGTLEAVRTDEGTCVRLRGYYGSKGQEVPVLSELAGGFDIHPDDEAAKIARWREARANLERLLIAPIPDLLPQPQDMTATGPPRRKSKKAPKTSIRESIRSHWLEVAAIQEVIQEISEEFDGEDPARPELRRLLEDIVLRLREMYERSKKPAEKHRLPRPRDDTKSLMREVVDSWASP